jgi:hypothetical protein
MNKRAGFNFQTYLIGLLLVMGILFSFAAAYVDMAEKYGLDTASAEDFGNTYNKVSDITTATKSMEEKTTDTNLGTESSAATNYGGALEIMKIITGLLSLPKEMIASIGNTFEIPPIWIAIAIAMIVILIVTTVLFMIFQTRG